jgi:hypothetical protein
LERAQIALLVFEVTSPVLVTVTRPPAACAQMPVVLELTVPLFVIVAVPVPVVLRE